MHCSAQSKKKQKHAKEKIFILFSLAVFAQKRFKTRWLSKEEHCQYLVQLSDTNFQKPDFSLPLANLFFKNNLVMNAFAKCQCETAFDTKATAEERKKE